MRPVSARVRSSLHGRLPGPHLPQNHALQVAELAESAMQLCIVYNPNKLAESAMQLRHGHKLLLAGGAVNCSWGCSQVWVPPARQTNNPSDAF